MTAVVTEKNAPDRNVRFPKCRIFATHLLFVLTIVLMSPFPISAADIYTFIGEGGEPLYTNIRAPGTVRVRFPLVAGKKNFSRGPQGMDMKKGYYDPIIIKASETFAVDPALVRSVIKVESNYNHLAVSPKGAMGLMQLMPSTARDMGVGEPFDPASNIHGGVMYLRQLLDTFRDDLSLSLAAYNAGPEKVLAKKAIPAIPETRYYVRRVLENYEKFKAINK